MVERKNLSVLRGEISEVLTLLGNPSVSELDAKLISVQPERYKEEIDSWLGNVPVEKRGLVRHFLDTRRSFVLMKKESGKI